GATLMSRATHRNLYLLVIVGALTGVLYAQLDRGALTGTVSDPSGAVIPEVRVSARNTATNAVYETKSTQAGQYTVPNLPVGTYEITFEANGFKKLVRSGITLGVTQAARVDA